jgi:hypothetical protein
MVEAGGFELAIDNSTGRATPRGFRRRGGLPLNDKLSPLARRARTAAGTPPTATIPAPR